MVTQVIRVRPDQTLSDVSQLMIKHLISGMPVCDKLDRVITMIGEGDTLRLAAEFGLDATVAHCLPRLVTADKLITLTKQAKFTDAYAIFLKHKIHRIPVIDSNGMLQGLITRSMIVKLFVESKIGRKIPQRKGA